TSPGGQNFLPLLFLFRYSMYHRDGWYNPECTNQLLLQCHRIHACWSPNRSAMQFVLHQNHGDFSSGKPLYLCCHCTHCICAASCRDVGYFSTPILFFLSSKSFHSRGQAGLPLYNQKPVLPAQKSICLQ